MRQWYWRNCREIAFSIQFWPLTWRLAVTKEERVHGVDYKLAVGPFYFMLYAGIGNCSSENRFEAWLGLSEVEAEDRAWRYSGARSEDGG